MLMWSSGVMFQVLKAKLIDTAKEI